MAFSLFGNQQVQKALCCVNAHLRVQSPKQAFVYACL